MNPHDELISQRDTAVTEHDVAVPAFTTIRNRGARLRRRRYAAVTGTLGLVGAIVATGVVIAPWNGQPDATTPTPVVPAAPSPSTVPPPPTHVQEPATAFIQTVVPALDNPALRAIVWTEHDHHFVVIADDTAVLTTYPARAGDSLPLVSPLGGDLFHVVHDDGSRVVIDPAGNERSVTVTERMGPVTDGEVLIPGDTPGVFFGIEPGTAVAHWVPVPAGTQTMATSLDGSLVGTATEGDAASVVWSHDGGATWESRVVSDDPSILLEVLPSASTTTIAVRELYEGGSTPNLGRLHRSVNGGETWETIMLGAQAPAITAVGVLPDGRLLVDVVDEGLHVSSGNEWTALTRVPQTEGAPPSRTLMRADAVLSMAARADGLVLTSWPTGDGSTVQSVDGGRTWVPVPSR